MLQNERAQTELQTFLRALHSYPEQFVHDPRITFEEYYESLIRSSKRESQNGC